ncbi:MAG: hypothetical protein JXA54_10875 [Candidatus Heimdallarchaeota archaeon]|nr:hypothetical protein [Candidatus Heimdallarchaeota archaeon]
MKNNLLLPLIVVSVAGLTVSTSLTGLYFVKLNNYNELSSEFSDLESQLLELLADYETLFGDNDDLQQQYDDLLSQYNSLELDYNDLVDLYAALLSLSQDLESEIDGLILSLKSLPMLDKMSFYYHLCRLNFNPWYDNQMVFARDLILHGSRQYNGFYSDVDSVLLKYNFFEYVTSMSEAWTAITRCLGDWMLDIRHYYFDLDTIFNWVTANIDYRYDSETAYGRIYPIDLFLSPLETLKYRCGDCDDYAILGGMLFEDSLIDVRFVTIHDSTYFPGELHHAFLWVNCEYADWVENSVSNPIWSFNGGATYEWLLCDLTTGWQQSIWHEPQWLTWYDNNGIVSSQWLAFVNTINCDPPT